LQLEPDTFKIVGMPVEPTHDNGKRENHDDDFPGDEPLTDAELWGDSEKPAMREPDFSSVRKHILKPWRILVFLLVSAGFWLLFFLFWG